MLADRLIRDFVRSLPGVTDTPQGVDLERLAPWFAANVEGATGVPLTATLISGGRSNLTYFVGDGTHEWVLRRPPLGHVLPTAHDMGREYKVLAGLAPTERAGAAPARVLRRPRGERRALLRDGEGRRADPAHAAAEIGDARAATTPGAAPKSSSTCS